MRSLWLHALDREPGERMQLMRAFGRLFGERHQFLRFVVRELELLLEQVLDGAAFVRVERIVHARGFDQQHRDRDLQIVAACGCRLGRREQLADAADNRSDHRRLSGTDGVPAQSPGLRL